MVFILWTANENAERETAQGRSRADSRDSVCFATQVLGAGDRRLAETERNVTLIGKTDA